MADIFSRSQWLNPDKVLTVIIYMWIKWWIKSNKSYFHIENMKTAQKYMLSDQ